MNTGDVSKDHPSDLGTCLSTCLSGGIVEKQDVRPNANVSLRGSLVSSETASPTFDVAGNLLADSEDEVEFKDGGIKEETELTAPLDRYNQVYLLFCLLGCGALIPWNFFITANEYFKLKLASEPRLVQTFQNYFSIAAMLPNILLQFLNVFLLHRVRAKVRVLASIVLMLLMFVLTTSLVLIDTSSYTEKFFATTVSTVVFISMSGAVLQGALFGLAGRLPEKYTQATFAGQGLGGFVAAMASILSLLAGTDIAISAFCYFATAALVLLICFFGFIYMLKLDFMKRSLRRYGNSLAVKLIQDDKVDCLNGDAADKSFDRGNALFQSTKKLSHMSVIRQVSVMALSAYLVFFVTLAAFPSTTARIVSVSRAKNPWTETYFVPVTCFLLFNVFDYVGRFMAGFVQWPGKRGPWLLLLCLARTVFLPLFAFCNAQPRLRGTPVLFEHDAFPILFMILFAVSNGYLSCLAMMYGPTLTSPTNAEVAGLVMSFSCAAGLASGAAFSFAIAPNL